MPNIKYKLRNIRAGILFFTYLYQKNIRNADRGNTGGLVSKSKHVIPVSIVAAVMLVLTVFGLIPLDVVVRLEFLRILTRESPRTPTLIKQVTVNPSAYGTTLHNVTVSVHGDKYVIKIDPLSLSAL
jgi:hypothetical protein